MATGPALQLTGTQILADARYWAQDQSAVNPAVSAADGLLRVNERLLWWQENVENRPKTLASTTTGLAFGANEMTKVATNDTGILEILSAHPAAAATVAYPLARGLKRVSIAQMYGLYYSQGNLTGGVVQSTGSEWTAFAAELDQTQQDDWRVFVYPALTTALNLTIRCTLPNMLGAIGDTADVSPAAARCIARLVGYDLAGVQKQNDAAYMQWIMSGVPQNVQVKMFGEAKNRGAQQSDVMDSGALSY